MFVIFNELRKLEAKRDAGKISAAEFARQKEQILSQIPDAYEAKGRVTRIKKAPSPNKTLWDILMLWGVAAVLCGISTWGITGDVGLAMTMGITIFAAFTIKLFVDSK